MAKKRQTTGLPKSRQRRSVESESQTPDGSDSVKRSYRSRAEREAEIQRWVIIATGIAIAILVVVVGGAFVVDRVINPNRVVATVQGQNILVSEFQQRVEFERVLLSSQLQQIAGQFQTQGFDTEQVNQILNSQEPYSTWLTELNFPDQLGQRVLNELVDEQIIREQAAERGILVSEADIQKQIDDFFGFDPESLTAEPTATVEPSLTPTPFVSPTPSPIPTITPTPMESPTPTLTPFPTIPPAPTFTAAEQQEQFEEVVDNFYSSVQLAANVGDEEINTFFEQLAIREALRSAVIDDITALTIHVNARHILLDTEEEARDVLDALEAGESFSDLARAVSTDTGSGSAGGELGWSPVTNYVEPFANAVRDAAIGDIVGPVESEFGFHIVQIHAREDRELSDADLERARNVAFDDWFQEQRAAQENEIEIFDIWSAFVPR